MDKETWSLVISVVGLALGVLSAHAQLKAVTKKALKASGDKARIWMARMEADADLYSANSSALISFLAKEFLSLIRFFFLTIGALAVLRSESFSAPLWGAQAITLAYAIWVGNKLADVSHIIDLTLRKARKSHANAG